MNAKPAIPTVLPAHSIFQLKRIPARKPRLALGPHPLHIIRMSRTKISIPDLCRAETHVFERSFIPTKHTAVRRDDDDGLRYGISNLAKFLLIPSQSLLATLLVLKVQCFSQSQEAI